MRPFDEGETIRARKGPVAINGAFVTSYIKHAADSLAVCAPLQWLSCAGCGKSCWRIPLSGSVLRLHCKAGTGKWTTLGTPAPGSVSNAPMIRTSLNCKLCGGVTGWQPGWLGWRSARCSCCLAHRTTVSLQQQKLCILCIFLIRTGWGCVGHSHGPDGSPPATPVWTIAGC